VRGKGSRARAPRRRRPSNGAADTPTLPVSPNAVASPAVAGINIVNYVYSCAQPGFTGTTQNFSYSAATNSFALTGPLECTACAATQFSLPTTASSGASGFVCRQCADFDPNLVLLPGGDFNLLRIQDAGAAHLPARGLDGGCGCRRRAFRHQLQPRGRGVAP
jgi:hypothetical protein